jgi:photosystem II stability/assembly factor-like uncharacterized protein
MNPIRFRPLGHAAKLVALVALALTASCATKQTAPPPPGVAATLAISGDTLRVAAGGVAHISATTYDSTGRAVTAPIMFSSTDSAVFVCDATGRLTGVSPGLALLIARSGVAADSAVVIVSTGERGWFAQSSGVSGSAWNAVFFLPDGRSGWIVGDGGRIAATADAGATWNLQTSNTASSLRSVWFTSESEGWAAGRNATLLHTSDAGVTWGAVNALGVSGDLNAVRFAGADSGWVATSVVTGLILRTTDGGLDWQNVTAPSGGNAINAIAAADSRDVYAVGNAGLILGTHDAGASWYRVLPSVTANALRSVARPTLDRANAVGAAGAAPFATASVDSIAWNPDNLGNAYDFYGVSFVSASTGWAVGSNGAAAILHTTDGGVTWTSQPANTPTRLNAVFFVDGQRGWAVGQNGVVLHTTTGGQP